MKKQRLIHGYAHRLSKHQQMHVATDLLLKWESLVLFEVWSWFMALYIWALSLCKLLITLCQALSTPLKLVYRS